MCRESLLSPERTPVAMKVIALGLRSRGREGRGGAGVPVAGAEAGEEVYAASLCGAAFCCCFSLKTFHSLHRVLWLQCPQRRGPAPGGSGAAGPRGPACLPVARRWLGTRRLPQAVLRYLLWCAAIRSWISPRSVSRDPPPCLFCHIRLSCDFLDRLCREPCEVTQGVWTAFSSRNSLFQARWPSRLFL